MSVLGIRDLGVEDLAASFETKTETGQKLLRSHLEAPSTDHATIQALQEKLRTIKTICRSEGSAISAAHQVLHDTEADVISIRDAAADKRHAEYYKQIMWDSGSRFAWINKIDWVGEIVLFFRTIFLPGLAVLLPLVVFIAPFFVYHFILKQPLSFGQYLEIVQTALKKTVPSVLGKPRFAGRGGIAEAGEQFIHIGVSLAMFGASMWNQVSAALNMRRVAADMRRRADSLRRFSAATAVISAKLGLATSIPDWPEGDLALFGSAWNDSALIEKLLAEAGRLDMFIAVATKKRTCFVSAGSHIDIQDIYHPGITPEKRVYNSIQMDGSGAHVLLTGPNRGGKSTLLKSLGAAVLMAQTFGIAFARKATMPIFGHIITALSPTDTLGKMSLFEAEIEFAKDVRARIAGRTADEPVFLMMDEIFHGTNAHDGVEASQVFLDDLYQSGSNVFSVVSTHYMDLPARYGGSLAQTLCMDAAVDSTDPDRLIYSYRLTPGINRYSSVREILRERGLLLSRGLPDEKRSESGSKA